MIILLWIACGIVTATILKLTSHQEDEDTFMIVIFWPIAVIYVVLHAFYNAIVFIVNTLVDILLGLAYIANRVNVSITFTVFGN